MSKLKQPAIHRIIAAGIEWKIGGPDRKPAGDVETYFKARRLTAQGRAKEAVALYRKKRKERQP